jgi:type 1 glutamine amidotransferase
MFRRTVHWFTALSMLATVAAVPACQFDQDGNLVNQQGVVVARLAAQSRPRVLYLTHTAGFKHDVLPHSETVLQKLGQDRGWDVLVTKDVGLLTASTLKDYAAVVFYTTGELPISDPQKQDLLAYIRGGGGIVGIHSATDTFYKWPEYGEIMGGYFDNHPWHEEVGVIVEDRTHVSTKHLPERFRITDEIYQHRNWSRDNVHVLVRLDPDTVDLTKKGVNRTDRDFGLSWTNTYGEGRSFYTAFGHRKEVWDDPRFQTHLVEGIHWAMKKM